MPRARMAREIATRMECRRVLLIAVEREMRWVDVVMIRGWFG